MGGWLDLMNTPLESDLVLLSQRAFGVIDWVGAVLRRYHEAPAPADNSTRQRLEKLRSWLLVPPSLWPFDVAVLLKDSLTHLERELSLASNLALLIDILPQCPSEAVVSVVAQHERLVQRGAYGDVINNPAKFDQVELDITNDPEFQHQWKTFTSTFDVESLRDHKGVIRRTMVVERNFRQLPQVSLHDAENIARMAFDAFCLRWNLYGMIQDEPLLLKLAVNVTAYGTLIHIPSYWSLDSKRDINWDAIAKLHRARVPHRQGARLALGKEERRKLAQKLQGLDQQAAALRLKGEKKHQFLCAGLGWVPDTSPKRITRLRAEFRK
jgi:hypothetical protein